MFTLQSRNSNNRFHRISLSIAALSWSGLSGHTTCNSVLAMELQSTPTTANEQQPSANITGSGAFEDTPILKGFLDLLLISENVIRKISDHSETETCIYMDFHNKKRGCKFYFYVSRKRNSRIHELIPADSFVKKKYMCKTRIKFSVELPLELLKTVLSYFDDNGLPNNSLPPVPVGFSKNDVSQVFRFYNFTWDKESQKELDDLVQHKSFFKDKVTLRLCRVSVRKAVNMIIETTGDLQTTKTLRTFEWCNVPQYFGKLHEFLDIRSCSRFFFLTAKPSEVTSAFASAASPKETPAPTSPASLKDKNTV